MPTTEFIDTELEGKINLLRYQMITTGMIKGLNHPDTVKYSQKLDLFLNKYNNVQKLNKVNFL